ncbi:esterase/lipase family protein [Syntrophorhabdus aromaticivorans]|uniref:esterase/lipase family protein n=1 Tax=Syntrophorhabdus aromaticivorans TaxID=328301 RepID=UPI0012EB9826|nr:alpha/beta fold hydrolase [Syntrophorhabdus aromaticivorans]
MNRRYAYESWAPVKSSARSPMVFRAMGCIVAVGVLLAVAGCATPVGVRYLSSGETTRRLTASVLSGDSISAPTTQILNRSGLAGRLRDEPEHVIADLHAGLPTARETDRLFALAELSFLHASKSGDRSYFLSAAIYAYAFLFPRKTVVPPNAFDPRFRLAADLYNQSLAKGFASEDMQKVMLKAGTYKVPFGELVVSMDPDETKWGDFRFMDFVDASELEVRGLRNWYRWPGIGAPLVASLERLPGVKEAAFAKVPPAIKVAATVFLRIRNVEEGLRTGRVAARLELSTVEKSTSTTVREQEVPLEFGLSSALAYTLEGSQVYRIELKGLFSGDFRFFADASRFRDNIFLMEPYRPGRIPLVLVHGTASSPARWAQMLNEIINDRELWGHYQIWLFTYSTGNPILYSGGLLAEGLRNTVKELDPEGKDPAMGKMVVIGHSQGGLLAKLTVMDSGTRFWDDMTSLSIDQLDVSPETKELARRSLFFKPLPFVRRVVFIATPHRGSFIAGGWIGRLTGRLISLPGKLLAAISEGLTRDLKTASEISLKHIPRSTDNMDPKSSFIRIISSIPIPPGVTTHSIIAVKNPDDPKEKWTDGVVDYSSAHIDGAASELIVRSGHSTQDEPQTIEEVRRILLENLKGPRYGE